MNKVSVFSALGKDGSEYCHPVDTSDFENIDAACDGTPKGNAWQPIRVEIITKDGRQKLSYSDAPWSMGNAIILRKSSVDALADILDEYAELLPLDCGEVELNLVNPLKVVNALDEGKSSIIRFDDGKIMMIRKYVFIDELIHGLDMFKLSCLRSSPVFLSERVVQRWKESNLEGLQFVKES